MTVNAVRINTLKDEWIEAGEAVLVELTPITDGIVNSTVPTIGPICVAADADGLTVIYERPWGSCWMRITLTGDEPTITLTKPLPPTAGDD